ncbi:hypothetical protein Tco_0289440 [Tanacetum coccineum]
MSTPTHFDSEIFPQTDGAQSSRVPIPLSDDPYRAVRQSHLTDTDIESGPLEDLREIEISQPPLVVPSPVPSSNDLHLTVGHDHTPATVDTESEPKEAPSEIEEFGASEPSDTRITSSHSSASSDSITPLSLDHPLTQTSPTPTPTRVSFYRRTARMAVRTQPTLSPGMSARIAKASALSPSSFCMRYRSSYETPSPSSSSTLPIRKRYQGTSELVEDTEEESSDSDDERDRSEDEGPGSEEGEEEAAPEGQQQAVSAEDTAMNEPVGLGYEALRRRELVVGEARPSTFDVGQSSRSVLEHEGAERIYAFRQPTLVTWVDLEDGRVYIDISTYVPPVAPVQTPPSPEWSSATIAVDEDEFLEVGAQLEPHESILHDHTQRLDALPPTLFEGYDRDLRELYTRSGAVRDEIFSQRYRLRSLEQEQERAIRAEMWRARYDDHRLIHDLLVHHTAMQHELQEMRGRVATLEQERSRREQ